MLEESTSVGSVNTRRPVAAAVVATGVANTAAVLAALRRAGAQPILTNDPAVIIDAPVVVLPGVGSFASGVAALRATGADGAIRERIQQDRATLAVCLGLQLLFESSDESPGERGLGLARGVVERFPPGVQSPQFGWNRVRAGAGCEIVDNGWAYFANSFRVTAPPVGWAVALTDHGGPFVAAMERGPLLACQFHPELSGAWGARIIERWLDRVRAMEVARC